MYLYLNKILFTLKTTKKTAFFALSYQAILEVYRSTCGFVNYSQCCTYSTKIRYWTLDSVFSELQSTLKFVYTGFKITVYEAKIRSCFMVLSCHIKKLQHKSLLRWQFGLVYLLFISWFICAMRWCIDKLGVFHANQKFMCLDPHLN